MLIYVILLNHIDSSYLWIANGRWIDGSMKSDSQADDRGWGFLPHWTKNCSKAALREWLVQGTGCCSEKTSVSGKVDGQSGYYLYFITYRRTCFCIYIYKEYTYTISPGGSQLYGVLLTPSWSIAISTGNPSSSICRPSWQTVWGSSSAPGDAEEPADANSSAAQMA